MKKLLLTVFALLLAAPALAAQQDIDQLSAVTASREALRTAVNTQLSKVQSNFDEVYAVIDAGPVYVNTTAPADTKVVWIDTDQDNAIRVYVGGAWTVVGTAGSGDDLGSAAYSDVVALWTTCTGYLKSDGTCDTPSGSATYPSAAGVANWNGSAWGGSYTVGTAAGNLVALDGSGDLALNTVDATFASVTVTRTTSPSAIDLYEGTGGGDNKMTLTLSGNLAADATLNADQILATGDVDDTPVNDVTTAPVSSNWAYDHAAASDPHAGYVLESAIGTTVQAYDADLASAAGGSAAGNSKLFGTNSSGVVGWYDIPAVAADEMAQDAVGGMFTGNTETGITITYDDATAKINATVATQFDGSQNTTGSSGSIGGVVTTSGITGALNLTKTGTTARTVTFPDAAGTVAFTSDIVAAPTDATITTTDVTTNNASTSKHGWMLKATAPASGFRNVVAIDNGETSYTNKDLFDATSPSTQASGDSAVVGTAMVAARRDHKHAMPTIPTVSDTAYDATSWNTNTDAPTKNAVRDVIETKANASSIAFEAATWSDLKILDTTHTTAGTGIALVQDSMAYANADDAYHLWSIDKIGSELAGKQASDSELTTWSGVTPGTGIATALAVNVGSAGAPVLFNGAGGTPSSLTLTNALLANSISLPGTCTVGQIYQDTDADTDGDIYFCRATNTWKAIDDDGGAGGLATTDIDTSAKLLAIVGNETGSASGSPLIVFNQSPRIDNIELGAATDTTIARGAAGRVTVESLYLPRIAASGSVAFDPASVNDGACSSATDGGTATGVATTDTINWNFSATPIAVTGYNPSGNLGYIIAYPTADHVNFIFCNKSGSAIDAGSVTLNWMVLRP